MKKLFMLVLSFLILSSTFSFARDYTKLQTKELKHAQKYGSTQRYMDTAIQNKPSTTAVNFQVKDPKIMKFGNYEKISEAKYDKKIKSDEKQYAEIEKSLKKRTVNNYNAQAKGEDYYKLYRISERIIRANNLDYQNWRIGVYRNSDMPNAYSTNNIVCISTSLFDTFADNDDALAIIIGHELAHSLLGHHQRTANNLRKAESFYSKDRENSMLSDLIYVVLKQKYLTESKNMEYAADVEGAKLTAKAGYNLDDAMDVIAFIETMPHGNADRLNTHPNPAKRKTNLSQNRKYFIEDEWKEMGKANIYNSDVLNVKQSSDRKSIVISGNRKRLNPEGYYRPETMNELYTRMAYKSYVNGEYKKALKFFTKLFENDHSNASAYLYASYTCEAMYKKTGTAKYLEDAKTFAQSALVIEPKNKFALEQIDSL